MPFAASLVVLTALLLAAGEACAGAEPTGPLPNPLRADVLVVGGTPPGWAAAVAAARQGASVVLLEPRSELGGDITGAWLNTFDMNWGPNREHLTRGLFLELYRVLGQTFDVAQARELFHRIARSQPRLRVLLNTRVRYPLTQQGRIIGVLAEGPDLAPVTVLARQTIDATDDGAVAVAAGVPYTVGREESGLDRRMQAATLIFRLAGVNPAGVARYLREVEQPFGRGGMWGRTAWGYREPMRGFRARSPRAAAYDLNLGWQSDGTVLVNALQVFDVDGTDPASVAEGRALALAELDGLVAYLRQAAPGFQRAVLVGAAPYLYIRETRHIFGRYRMREEDILEGSDFWDRIAVASYPIDIHPYQPGQFYPFSPVRRAYSIPYRMLVASGVEDLQVVGKALSASYVAYGSLRVIPTLIALGEAAGTAAALCVQWDISPSRLAVDPDALAALQNRLVAQGAYLTHPGSVAVRTGGSDVTAQ
ncbi:MAG TPA: FAD-dependent oxidoreductase [Limnochordales bacterium]